MTIACYLMLQEGMPYWKLDGSHLHFMPGKKRMLIHVNAKTPRHAQKTTPKQRFRKDMAQIFRSSPHS